MTTLDDSINMLAFRQSLAHANRSPAKIQTFEGLLASNFGFGVERTWFNSGNIKNYQTFLKSIANQNSQLRVNLSGKFYIIIQSPRGVSKIVDSVKNFFIKLVREGRGADATLKGRLRMPLGQALEQGLFNELFDYSVQISDICSSRFLNREEDLSKHLKRIDISLKNFSETILRISKERPEQSQLLDRIDAIVNKFHSILKVIPTQVSFPTLNIVNVRVIARTVLKEDETAALAETGSEKEEVRAAFLDSQLTALQGNLTQEIAPLIVDAKKQLKEGLVQCKKLTKGSKKFAAAAKEVTEATERLGFYNQEYQPKVENLLKQARDFQSEQKNHECSAAEFVKLAKLQKARLEMLLNQGKDISSS